MNVFHTYGILTPLIFPWGSLPPVPVSSHDDFSVVSMLPEDVAVLSHLRDPVDRFLSAYEFAVEVGCGWGVDGWTRIEELGIKGGPREAVMKALG